MLYTYTPCLLACQHAKAQPLWNIVTQITVTGEWSSGAKVRCETKKNLNTSQITSAIFINYDSKSTDDSSEFWPKLFYLVQMP